MTKSGVLNVRVGVVGSETHTRAVTNFLRAPVYQTREEHYSIHCDFSGFEVKIEESRSDLFLTRQSKHRSLKNIVTNNVPMSDSIALDIESSVMVYRVIKRSKNLKVRN